MKTPFTRDEHFALGRQLKEAHRVVIEALVTICGHYPIKGPETRAAERAYRAIGHLKHVMDNAICRERPMSEGDVVRAYYGPNVDE